MPITLTPYDHDETILIYSFEGDWNWSEFIALDKIVLRHLEERDDLIHRIFDLTRSNGIPLGIQDILHRAGQRTEFPNQGLGVMVKAPSFIHVIMRALKRIYPKTENIYHFADTLDEALQLIEKSCVL